MCFDTGNDIKLDLTIVSHLLSFNNICNGLFNLFTDKIKISDIILNNKVEGRV